MVYKLVNPAYSNAVYQQRIRPIRNRLITNNMSLGKPVSNIENRSVNQTCIQTVTDSKG